MVRILHVFTDKILKKNVSFAFTKADLTHQTVWLHQQTLPCGEPGGYVSRSARTDRHVWSAVYYVCQIRAWNWPTHIKGMPPCPPDDRHNTWFVHLILRKTYNTGIIHESAFHIIPDLIIPVDMSFSTNDEFSILINFLLTGVTNWDTEKNEKMLPFQV